MCVLGWVVFFSGGLRDENLCGQEGQEAKKRGALNTPLFSRHASPSSPSHRIRLDKTATPGVVRGGNHILHPTRSHSMCKPGLLQQEWYVIALGDLVWFARFASLSLTHVCMYVHTHVTYVHSAQLQRHADTQTCRTYTCHPRHPDALHTHHTSQLLYMQACAG